jgi:hypothetical protein
MNIDFMKKCIERLQLELENGTPDFDSYKSSIKQLPLIFRADASASGSIFRASFLDQREFGKPTNKHRFSYPNPKRGIKVFRGRANVADKPVFYGAKDIVGAIMELILTQSDSKISNRPNPLLVW